MCRPTSVSTKPRHIPLEIKKIDRRTDKNHLIYEGEIRGKISLSIERNRELNGWTGDQMKPGQREEARGVIPAAARLRVSVWIDPDPAWQSGSAGHRLAGRDSGWGLVPGPQLDHRSCERCPVYRAAPTLQVDTTNATFGSRLSDPDPAWQVHVKEKVHTDQCPIFAEKIQGSLSCLLFSQQRSEIPV